jgi:hypothetical protein
MEKETNLEEILRWIITNQKNTRAMNKINEFSFRYTRKYQEWKIKSNRREMEDYLKTKQL